MRILKSIFKNQLKTAVNKRNVLAFLVIAVILQIFLQVGKANHNNILESIEKFQKQERQKVTRYLHYRQYGSFGIWLKFIPHVNSILYFDSTFDNLLCNVDSTYVFNIYTPVKGKNLFASRTRFLNFSIMFLFFGSLICLIYGMDTTANRGYLKFVSTLSKSRFAFGFHLMTRLFILFLAVIFLYVISVLPLLVFYGINLFSTSFTNILVTILIFLFFFSLGSVFGNIKTQAVRYLLLTAIFFLMVILLPWVLDFYTENSAKDMPSLIDYDSRNFNVLMQAEDYWKKKYGEPKSKEDASEEEIKVFIELSQKMKKTFKDNEEKLKNQSLSKMKAKHTISCFIPTLFYFSFCESSSSTCVSNHIDFHTYCQKKKEEFVDFIINRRFPPKKAGEIKEDKKETEQIENFVKGNDDLFFSKPRLPHNFWLGVFFTVIYTVLLLSLSYRILKKKIKIPEPEIIKKIAFEKGNTLFLLCENEDVKRDVFNKYQNQSNTVCLEKVNTSDFFLNGVKPMDLFKHLCILNGAAEGKAIENLKLMGIRDLAGFKEFSHELTLKIIAAVKIAVDFDRIVINDFVKKESRQFEIEFFNLLLQLETEGKKILYLSCQMILPANSFFEDRKIDGFMEFPLNIKTSTLR